MMPSIAISICEVVKPNCDVQSARSRTARTAIEVAVTVAIMVIALNAWLLSGLVEPMVVTGDSMLPALTPGERVLVDRSAFLWRAARRWETVVLRAPHEPTMLCIKRVAGLPGETVSIAGGRLLIDGRVETRFPADQDVYYTGAPALAADVRLAADEYFVLGDNSRHSIDSRDWLPAGRVTGAHLVGRALVW